MGVIEARDVSKRFRLFHERPNSLKERVVRGRGRAEDFWALRDVSVEVEGGETFALVGANGSGKSTLLKILAAIMRPTSGTVATRGRIASLLELGAGFHEDLTGRENVFLNASILGISRKETERYFDDIVAFAELEPFIDMQIKRYSSGMKVRLGFAVAVHVDPEILLVDEVLAVGDEAFQKKCLHRIRRFQQEGRTIVLVTHNFEHVLQICHRGALLDHGRLLHQGDPVSVVRAARDILHPDLTDEDAGDRERAEINAPDVLRIVDVRIVDASGEPRAEFATGDPLGVVIDVEGRRPVPDAVVGVAVYNENEQMQFGTNTDVSGVPLDGLEGKTRIAVWFDRLPMFDGRFQVSIGVHNPDSSVVYDWHERRYGFRVRSAGWADGRFYVPSRIDVEKR